MMELRTQIEEKAKELDRYRERLSDSSEIEAMRLRLLEEMEVKQRLQSEVQELENYGIKFNELRRIHELTKTDYELEIQSLKKRLEEAGFENEQRVQDLKSTINNLKERLESKAEIESKRSAIKEKEELAIKCKQLVEELLEVRNEKERIRAEKEESCRNHSRMLQEEVVKASTAQNEAERLAKKFVGVQQDLERSAHANDRLQEKLTRIESEKQSLRSQLEELQELLQSEKTISKEKSAEREAEIDRQRLLHLKQRQELQK